MNLHRYPASVVVVDALTAVTGIVLTGTPLILLDAGFVGSIVFGPLFLVFLVFSVRTVMRHLRSIFVDAESVSAVGPFGRRLCWGQLAVVRLRYYSTRWDRERGWFELVLTDADRCRLSVDGRLNGFDSIAQAAARCAGERGLRCDAATVHNFRILGIPVFDNTSDA